jgi:hypothetical protein
MAAIRYFLLGDKSDHREKAENLKVFGPLVDLPAGTHFGSSLIERIYAVMAAIPSERSPITAPGSILDLIGSVLFSIEPAELVDAALNLEEDLG